MMLNYTRARRIVFTCTSLGAAALLSGCLATHDWVEETVGAQVQTLTKRVSQLETNLGQVSAQVAQLGPQVAETRTAVNAENTRVTRALASRNKREMVSQVHLQFAGGKYELGQAQHDALNGVLKSLQDNPTYTADVVGYTDGEGKARSNVALSWNREESVRRYLVEKGASLDRIYFIGLGEDVTKGDVSKGPYVRAKDRQVSVLIYRPVD
jgi:outer membrane protein OmpA-like peptidoglycan-associated protein